MISERVLSISHVICWSCDSSHSWVFLLNRLWVSGVYALVCVLRERSLLCVMIAITWILGAKFRVSLC